MRQWLLGLVLVMSGCNYDAPSEITCAAADSRAGFACVGGYWVTTGASDTGLLDMTSDQSNDAAPDTTCTSPTPAQFCASLGNNCGTVSGTDACGDARTENCGTCVAPDTCQADNTCTCNPEDDDAFCARLGKDCDDTTAADNCGATRTVNCGTCDVDQTCGEEAPNVCGCPCAIDGTCVAEGLRNPANQCEVCDSAANPTGWTLAAGASCDDQDQCTVTDVCDAAGVCAGAAKDCSAQDGVCKIGQCDAANGNCIAANKPEQTVCGDDGLACTSDVCVAGVCESSLAANTCLISGTCVAANATRGSNVCEKCAPATSTTAWSPNNGVSCDDGVSCTTGDVCANRSCVGTLVGCNIVNVCVAEGAARDANSCFVCNSATNATTYTPLTAGSACPVQDGLACTSQLCAGDGSCSTFIAATHCVIDGACVLGATLNPANPCQLCAPLVSQSAWTNAIDLSLCPGGATCACRSGICQKSNGMSCP